MSNLRREIERLTDREKAIEKGVLTWKEGIELTRGKLQSIRGRQSDTEMMLAGERDRTQMG